MVPDLMALATGLYADATGDDAEDDVRVVLRAIAAHYGANPAAALPGAVLAIEG